MNSPEDAPRDFQGAWNNHDMNALAKLFHADATFVNRFGHYARGVGAIVAMHAPTHATIYSDSSLENELIDVVPIGDAAAVVHFWSRLASGAAHPGGAARRRHAGPRRADVPRGSVENHRAGERGAHEPAHRRDRVEGLSVPQRAAARITPSAA
jgi:uncharacterized protein (TIGR02246 family)